MKKLYEEEEIKAIANAIRTKNGTANKYTTAQMPAAITSLVSSVEASINKSSLSANTTINVWTKNTTASKKFRLLIRYQVGNVGAYNSSTVTITLQGSQNNSSWTNLKSQAATRASGTNNATFSLTWDNITGYAYYRIRAVSTDNETTCAYGTTLIYL